MKLNMTIVSLTGADIARIFENGQHLICFKLKYDRGDVYSDDLIPGTNTAGYILMWVIVPRYKGLFIDDFCKIQASVAGLFPNRKMMWAYEEVKNKQDVEIIVLTNL